MPPLRCLLIAPKFSVASFWNYGETCQLLGTKYPVAPLSLITVAAMLPKNWELKLVDRNVEELSEANAAWANIVFVSGMITQSDDHLDVIRQFKKRGVPVVVGGPNASASPAYFREADHLVLGEAEVTLPEFLRDLESGKARPLYDPAGRRADTQTTPIPRFDLLSWGDYLALSIHYILGSTINCEICDVIEFMGRVPRGKQVEQVIAELQTIYDLGYRGHIQFADDNLIASRAAMKLLLPRIQEWSIQHDWPFDFSGSASINLAHDRELMTLMRDAGFIALFAGIETPDPKTLLAIQKPQNQLRPLTESVHELLHEGILVYAGYVIGFDSEQSSVSARLIEHIEASAVPINSVGPLSALPTTQFEARLRREGRLKTDHSYGDIWALPGLNFETLRPRTQILQDLYQVNDSIYSPSKYFGRVRHLARLLGKSNIRARSSRRTAIKHLKTGFRILYHLGFRPSYRWEFWRTLIYCALRNPHRLHDLVHAMAMYLHLAPLRERLNVSLGIELERPPDSLSAPLMQPVGSHQS